MDVRRKLNNRARFSGCAVAWARTHARAVSAAKDTGMSTCPCHRSQVIARRYLALAMILVWLWAAPHDAAQPLAQAAPPPPPAAATQPADVDATIRQLLPQLLDRSTGARAIEQLTALRDVRVLLAFRRIADRAVCTVNEKLVYVPDDFKRNDKGEAVGHAYDLFAPVDSSGLVKADPLQAITAAEAAKAAFDPPRPVRNLI